MRCYGSLININPSAHLSSKTLLANFILCAFFFFLQFSYCNSGFLLVDYCFLPETEAAK